MRNDIYNLVTVDDGKTDNAAIVKVLSSVAAGTLNCDLKLLNYYEEMPVSYGTNINCLEGDSVELSVHEYQALVISHDKSTLLKSRHFQNGLGVHCHAAYVNVAKNVVVLHNFAYAQIRSERREAVRVKVQGNLLAKFRGSKGTFGGSIVDISGNGIALHTASAPTLVADDMGQLHFMLDNNCLEAQGCFVRAVPDGQNGYLYMFKMSADRKSDSLIGSYIFRRQIEIIMQLKDGKLLPETEAQAVAIGQML